MSEPRRPAPTPRPARPQPATPAPPSQRPVPRPVEPEQLTPPPTPPKPPKPPKPSKPPKPPKARKAPKAPRAAKAPKAAKPPSAPRRRRPAKPRQPLAPVLPARAENGESSEGSRAQRLRAERTARRLRLRRVLEIAAAVLAIVVIVSLALAFSGGSTGPKRAGSSTPTPTPTITGASLRDPGLATTYLGSAASDIAAITTYDYRRLDDALNAGLAVTTGKYREQYRLALTGDLARTAAAEHVVHTFEVLDVGIGAMTADGNQATVLVFGRERITDDRTGPAGDVTPITLCATIRRDGNRFLVSDLTQDTDPGLPPGGAALPLAVTAARTEVVNLLSFQRSEFPADLQRAVDGATSPLREQLQSGAAGAKAELDVGKYDSSGTVTATAVVRAGADAVTLLIAAQETRAVDDANEPTVLNHRYEVTVTRTAAGWAVSGVVSVDGAG
ncbi:MAG: hypothetical protein QOH89_54 [Pseudonocardiales bacterium]|nr:hypothetical protein [Pseudonocardiales bacterium]